MKKSVKQLKNVIIAFVGVWLLLLSVATAWATITVINSDQGMVKISKTQINDSQDVAKTFAPEPGTLALFGGGFLGMIISFVRRTYAFAKRAFDIIASVAGIIILSPILLIVAILIKLTSKGPILYTQIRVGQFGENFKIYKFRSMRQDAEKETGPVWAAKNDNRLTPIGAFLRKSHIDEIPQLINVLRGEMSVIGPRPERPTFVDQFTQNIPDYSKRLMVKPGITGLAQVWHRYDETINDVKKKLRYDLLYIKKMCFWGDMNIILRTCRVVITGEGAR